MIGLKAMVIYSWASQTGWYFFSDEGYYVVYAKKEEKKFTIRNLGNPVAALQTPLYLLKKVSGNNLPIFLSQQWSLQNDGRSNVFLLFIM